MVLKFPPPGKKHAPVISFYVPIMTNSDEFKYNIYEDLSSNVPKRDKLIVLRDVMSN